LWALLTDAADLDDAGRDGVRAQELLDVGDDLGRAIGPAAGTGANEEQGAGAAALLDAQAPRAFFSAGFALMTDRAPREALDGVATGRGRRVAALRATRGYEGARAGAFFGSRGRGHLSPPWPATSSSS
jgi:hypothetical protein